MYFIQAFKLKNEWWRYMVTIAVVAFAYFVLGSIPLTVVMLIKVARGGEIDIEAFNDTYDPSALGLEQNLGLFLLLVPSVLSFIALLLMMILMHYQTPGGIASAAGRFRWGRFMAGAALWLIMLATVESYFAYSDPANYAYNFDKAKFIPLLFIAIFIIPIQAMSEELFFRSYLIQGLGIWFNSRLLSLIITSILFGLMHSMNPEVKEFGFLATMPYYIGFGLFAGLLVVFDNGIEMACSVHVINNMYSAVLVSYNSSALQTAALWKIRDLDPVAMTIAFAIMATIFLIIMAKAFNWEKFPKLFKAILRDF